MKGDYLLELELLNSASGHLFGNDLTQVIYGGACKLSTLEGEKLARRINGKYLKKKLPHMRNSINIKKEQSVNHRPTE